MAVDFAKTGGIGLKVFKILEIAQKKVSDHETIEQIVVLTDFHSDRKRIGLVGGFSVSEYAFAALKWIGSEFSLRKFAELFASLSDDRKMRVNELVDSKAYMKI